MIAKTAAAATNSLDAPVIGDDPNELLEERTQGYRLTFPKSGPHSPQKDESKKGQDIVTKGAKERPPTRVFRYDRRLILGGSR
jgi:hypothetical protein